MRPLRFVAPRALPRTLLALLCALALLACARSGKDAPDGSPGSDAATGSDAGTPDAATGSDAAIGSDAGTPDAATGSDAALQDAAPQDAATTPDAAPDPCGDPSVIPTFTHGAWNPVLTPRAGTAAHGDDNIYAPDILRLGAHLCLMWYGGQGGDGHDRIFLATSTDCFHFKHYPDQDAPVAVLDNGTSNHVNDPSVIAVNGVYYMYYTDAASGIDDRIHLATSPDGVTWTKQGEVIGVGAAGAWDDYKVGRPAAFHQGTTFYVWYDGNDGSSRHVGLATSPDGFTFTKHASNPLVLNAGAVDVELFSNG
ncbi:MAG: hypothetical protein ACK2U9_19555, partial [Anaerolineae bacterium]